MQLNMIRAQYIIETFVSGQAGYRIWSDGYCEQWGFQKGTGTVTLVKEYKDIDYNISLTNVPSQIGNSRAQVYRGSITTNSFQAEAGGSYSDRYPWADYWFTSGYLADTEYSVQELEMFYAIKY